MTDTTDRMSALRAELRAIRRDYASRARYIPQSSGGGWHAFLKDARANAIKM